MEPLGRSCMHDLPLVKLFYIEYYREIWVRGHSRLLKLIPFKRLGVVSYLASTVTMVLSGIVCKI